MKYARRTFAIVSTISIPHPAPISPMEAIVNPPSRGFRLDADHPQNGGLIPCRFTPVVARLGRACLPASVVGFFDWAVQPHLDQMQHAPINDTARHRL